MKKKLLILTLALAGTISLSACGNQNTSAAATQDTQEEVTTEDAKTVETQEQLATDEPAEAISDEEAAAHVAELIDAIYVQTRTDETDAQCEEAKKAWDALTDEQKEMVEGEEADPDYFGRDTGDASKDDPLNQDDIGDKEILVVSFGTSFNDSRSEDIGGIEKAIAKAYPDFSVRRAFTAQIIINHVQARDGEKIDNMEQALDRAVANGVKELVVQPTHLMHGAEYDELMEAVEKYADKFEQIVVSEPMLGEVGEKETSTNADKKIVSKEVVNAAMADAGFADAASAAKESTALVLLGHGTSHKAKVTYSQMNAMMKEQKFSNVFVGTVEGEPEETEINEVINKVKEAGFTKVILRPLMVVAGDHANNDMAGDDEDSWKSLFEADGSFESIDCQIAGLGRISAIEQLYVEHIKEALDASGIEVSAASNEAKALLDGVYLADFKTDSGMFHVHENYDGKGELTVKNGEMTIKAVLSGDGILNLYAGLSKDAKANEAKWLQPEKVTVKYDDGTSEDVNAFVIPVPAIGEEFDVALIGKKGKWYDHKVSVENPVKK